jgi:hypothetical protein
LEIRRVEEQPPTAPTDGLTTPMPIVLSGVQHVTKFNRTAFDEVLLFVALFRIKQKNVDLVLTFNVPVVAQEDIALDQAGQTTAREQFETAARTLKIVDFGLFA